MTRNIHALDQSFISLTVSAIAIAGFNESQM
jgi:hypothetical protein